MQPQSYLIPSDKALLKNKKKRITFDELFLRITENNDLQSFSILFERYYTPLCKFAFRTVNSMEVAEEVVSDVFLRLWNNRHKIKAVTCSEAYIYRSVKNQGLDYLRSSLNEKCYKDSIDDFLINSLNSPFGIPDLECEYLETYRKVEGAISRLPKKCQIVFRMNRIDGLKYREVAEKLDISIKTVEAQINFALKQLRLELANVQL